jgi:hypothetical protein
MRTDHPRVASAGRPTHQGSKRGGRDNNGIKDVTPAGSNPTGSHAPALMIDVPSIMPPLNPVGEENLSKAAH